MQVIEALVGLCLLLVVLVDAFETVILPRSVARPVRLSRFLVDGAWRFWRSIGSGIRATQARETWLGAFGPLSLVGLIVSWAILMIVGFAFVQEGLATPLVGMSSPTFGERMYLSATTFFTVGFGDITAKTALGRTISVIEGGTGLGFLAVVISYLPVLYQSFSRREATILLLDSRAGSPPDAGELLLRAGDDQEGLADLFKELERWSAGSLESFLSYPILAYYRSQHDKLTWLATLATALDACALISLAEPGSVSKPLRSQAAHTYAIARHLIVDLAYIIGAAPVHSPRGDLEQDLIASLGERLSTAESFLRLSGDVEGRFAAVREEYEPYLAGLSRHLLVPLPPIGHVAHQPDSWQTTAWDMRDHF